MFQWGGGGGGVVFQMGASFLSGWCTPWGASVLMWGFSKKIVAWRGGKVRVDSIF